MGSDLKNRIIFTVFILCVYRFGTYVPLTGIDPEATPGVMQMQSDWSKFMHLKKSGKLKKNGVEAYAEEDDDVKAVGEGGGGKVAAIETKKTTGGGRGIGGGRRGTKKTTAIETNMEDDGNLDIVNLKNSTMTNITSYENIGVEISDPNTGVVNNDITPQVINADYKYIELNYDSTNTTTITGFSDPTIPPITVSTTVGAPDPIVSDNSLIAHYKFDSLALLGKDNVGSKDLTISSVSFNPNGEVDGFASFSSTGQYLTKSSFGLDFNAIYPANGLSFSLWVNIPSSGGEYYAHIFMLGVHNTNGRFVLFLLNFDKNLFLQKVEIWELNPHFWLIILGYIMLLILVQVVLLQFMKTEY